MTTHKVVLLAVCAASCSWLASSFATPPNSAGLRGSSSHGVLPLVEEPSSAYMQQERLESDGSFSNKLCTMAMACMVGLVMGIASAQPVSAADKPKTGPNFDQGGLCAFDTAWCESKVFQDFRKGIVPEAPPAPKPPAPKAEEKKEEAPPKA